MMYQRRQACLALLAILLAFLGSSAAREGKDLVDMEFCGNDDCYEVLNVTADSTRGEIRRAYHKLSLQYHPDKVGDKSDEEKAASNAKFLKVSSAYEVLANEKSRQSYDIWVKGGRKRRPKPGEEYDGPMPSYYRDEGFRDVKDTPDAFIGVFVTLLISIGIPLYMSMKGRIKKWKKLPPFVYISELFRTKEKPSTLDKADTPTVSRKERRGEAAPRPSKQLGVANISAVSSSLSENNKSQIEPSPETSAITKVSGPWSPEEDAELTRAVAKFPGGSMDRWSNIAKFIGTRTEEDCIARYAELKQANAKVMSNKPSAASMTPDSNSKPRPDNSSQSAKISINDYAKKVKEAQTSSMEATNVIEGRAWTAAEQALLENAMRLVDKSVSDRWDKIAEMIPSRSKKEVIARVKDVKKKLSASTSDGGSR